MDMKKYIVAIANTLFAVAAMAGAAFSVDNIFGDGMVVQRRKPVRVSGNAEPALTVTATYSPRRALRGTDSSSRCRRNGRTTSSCSTSTP